MHAKSGTVVAYRTEKHLRCVPIHSISSKLDAMKPSSITFFHAFTGCLIYLQKAFDPIDHELLRGKMLFIGFSEEVIGWCRSYLLK